MHDASSDKRLLISSLSVLHLLMVYFLRFLEADESSCYPFASSTDFLTFLPTNEQISLMKAFDWVAANFLAWTGWEIC